jgi:hypothetical protein
MDRVVDPASLSLALAGSLAARYAAVFNIWDGEPNEKIEGQLRLLRVANQDLALLQKTLHRASQHKKESEQALREEEKKQAVAPIMAKLDSEALALSLGGTPRGQKMADYISAIQHDLPPKDESPSVPVVPSVPQESNPVQPSPTNQDTQADDPAASPVRPHRKR